MLAPPNGLTGAKERFPTIQSAAKASHHPSPSQNRSMDSQSSENSPARPRKIRRPILIRRPKLVGKSVEGAAMQAVVASRKRASSNQFKNVAASNPSRRPQNPRLARQSSKDSQVGEPQKSTIDSSNTLQVAPRSEREERDENFDRVRSDFLLLCSAKESQLQRRSSLHRQALLKLATLWWPQKKVYGVPFAVGKMLASKAPLAWSDSRPLPPIPTETQEIFVIAFARYVAAFTPGLKLVPLAASQYGTKSSYPSVLLSSDIRNVRGSKCLAVVLISKAVSSRSEDVVRCQTAILNLPRRTKAQQRVKIGSNFKATLASEKDAAGMDKVAADLHVSLYLLFFN